MATTGGEEMRLIQVPPGCKKYSGKYSRWFAKHITRKLGEIYDCYTAKIEEDFNASLVDSPTTEIGNAYDDRLGIIQYTKLLSSYCKS